MVPHSFAAEPCSQVGSMASPSAGCRVDVLRRRGVRLALRTSTQGKTRHRSLPRRVAPAQLGGGVQPPRVVDVRQDLAPPRRQPLHQLRRGLIAKACAKQDG